MKVSMFLSSLSLSLTAGQRGRAGGSDPQRAGREVTAGREDFQGEKHTFLLIVTPKLIVS